MYSRSRSELERLIADYGSVDVYQDLYKRAERVTGVEVAVVRLFKPISSSNPEFEGFYHDMPELNETSGVVRYNDIQALVNNYTGAVRCFDRFAEVGIELNAICKQLNFGSEGFNFKVSSDSHDGMIVDKMVFAKALQKKCWSIVFSKFDLEKYLTKGVMSDVNKFVESRQNYPFTMKNIFRMVEIIVGTKDNSMQRAVVEAVDNFTRHTHENRFGVEGWKTNTGHMLNKKFITPNICENQYSWEKNGCVKIDLWKHNFETIMDLTKALCFLTGKDYNTIESIKTASLLPEQKQALAEYREDDRANGVKFNPLAIPDRLSSHCNQFVPNTWYEWGFFRFKVYRKGTGHFEFLDENDWAKLNQAYAKAKGQVLPEKIFKKKK